MRSKELISFISFLFLIFLGIIVFTPGVSAQITCSASDQIILRLSSATNAHGEVFNGAGGYTEEICYDTIFGVAGNGDRTCDPFGANKILGLFSATNAHAEAPDQTNYAIEICYGNMVCNVRTANCGIDNPNEVLIVSLSDTTNAHLASDNSYPTKICCTFGEAAPSCSLTDAYWNTTSGSLDVVEGTIVELIVEGVNCDEENVSFEVWEDDVVNELMDSNPPEDVTFNGTTATGIWTAEWQCDGELFGVCTLGDPEYFFKVFVNSLEINSGGAGADELHVTEHVGGDCQDIVVCGDYNNQISCDDDECVVADVSGGNIDCDDPQIECGCSWISASGSCNATWSGSPPGDGGEKIGTCTYGEDTTDNCDDGFLTFNWTATWTWADTGVDPPCDIGYVLGGDEKCHYDPNKLSEDCDAGSTYRVCPAQIPLPFFGAYNFIVALAIIALIYILWASNQRKRKSKK